MGRDRGQGLCRADLDDLPAGEGASFRQAKELGGHVRKGEKGSLVVYADRIRKTEIDEGTGEEEEREIPFLKGYTVFCVDQIVGLPERYYPKAEPRLDPVQRIDHAESYFAATVRLCVTLA